VKLKLGEWFRQELVIWEMIEGNAASDDLPNALQKRLFTRVKMMEEREQSDHSDHKEHEEHEEHEEQE